MIRRILPLLLLPLLSFCSTEHDDHRQSEAASATVPAMAPTQASALAAPSSVPRTHDIGTFSASCQILGGQTKIAISNRSSNSLTLSGNISIFYFNDFNISQGSTTQSISRTVFPGNRIEFLGPTPPSSATQCDVDVTEALLHPPAPLNLRASNVDYHDLDLTWSSGGGDTRGFFVMATPAPTSDFTCQSGASVGNTLSTHFSSLDEGRYYYLRVCSENNFGLRTSSLEVRVATRAHPAPNPTGLVITADGLTRLKAEWQSGGGTTFYYRAQIVAGTSAPAESCPASQAVTTGKIVFTGLNPDTEYTIRICAANINDLVTNGIVASGKTQDPSELTLPFVDDFSGSDRSTLGVAWTVGSGTFAVASGVLKTDSASSIALLNTLDTYQNVTVGIQLVSQPKKCECSVGVAARAQSVSTMYIGRVRQSKTKDYAELVVLQNGQETVLKSLKLKKVADNSKLELRVSGASLKFLINGSSVVEATDSRLPSAGRIGIYGRGTGQVADNFFGN